MLIRNKTNAGFFLPYQARSSTTVNKRKRSIIIVMFLSDKTALVGQYAFLSCFWRSWMSYCLDMKHVLLAFVFCSSLHAQWPDVPSTNLPVCTASGEQAISKLVATEHGGCYVAWFDNRVSGYDVYIQHFAPDGTAMWQENGILIADRSYSSTMDFDIDIDSQGNAVVVYRDTVGGSDGVSVSWVRPDGTIAGEHSIAGNGAFVASPVVTAIGDHTCIGWIHDESTKLQRYDENMLPIWMVPRELNDPAGGSLYVADMHPSDDGSVLASFVQYTTFWGNKQLKAQKIDPNGDVVWASLVDVMQDNSLQIGAYPDFISDGSGGGFFTWYGVNPLQSYATRIDTNGNQWFAGQVQIASSLGSTVRTNPVATRIGEEFAVFFRQQNSTQSTDGICAQLLSSNGGLLWGNSGVELLPLSSSPQYLSFSAATTNNEAMLVFVEEESFGNASIKAVALNAKGGYVWGKHFLPVSSTPSTKSRIASASTHDGVLLAWQDDRNDGNDIYAQRINGDGTLGNVSACHGDIDSDGFVGVGDILRIIDAWGDCAVLCEEDLNEDGFVDVADLLVIIDAWGVCS